jgi:hypothetical protein
LSVKQQSGQTTGSKTIAQFRKNHWFNLAGVNSPPLCGETSSLQCQPLADEQNGLHTPSACGGVVDFSLISTRLEHYRFRRVPFFSEIAQCIEVRKASNHSGQPFAIQHQRSLCQIIEQGKYFIALSPQTADADPGIVTRRSSSDTFVIELGNQCAYQMTVQAPTTNQS